MPDEKPDRFAKQSEWLKWTSWLLVAFLVVVVLAWLRFGEFPAAIYAETKFEEVRWGPHQTIEEVDQTLSWFNRSEISRDNIQPNLLRGKEIERLLKSTEEVQFISYYVGKSGFIVVYDKSGTKLTQLKSDV